MIVVNVKEGESIDRALKRYKRKFDRMGMMRQLRGRQAFTKPSIERRSEIIRAAYVEKLKANDDE